MLHARCLLVDSLLHASSPEARAKSAFRRPQPSHSQPTWPSVRIIPRRTSPEGAASPTSMAPLASSRSGGSGQPSPRSPFIPLAGPLLPATSALLSPLLRPCTSRTNPPYFASVQARACACVDHTGSASTRSNKRANPLGLSISLGLGLGEATPERPSSFFPSCWASQFRPSSIFFSFSDLSNYPELADLQ